jgi:hypothetical protein
MLIDQRKSKECLKVIVSIHTGQKRTPKPLSVLEQIEDKKMINNYQECRIHPDLAPFSTAWSIIRCEIMIQSCKHWLSMFNPLLGSIGPFSPD